MVVYKELNKPNSIGSKWFSGVLDRAHWSSNVFFCWEMSRKSTAFSVKPPQVTRNEALTNFHYKEKFHCYRHHSKENNYTR